MKHFVKGSMIAAVGVSIMGFAIASGVPALDAATLEAGLMAAAPAKSSVSEKFAKTGVWADSDVAADFWPSEHDPATVSVGTGGVITITYAGGEVILLTPTDGGNGQVDWSCSTKAIPAELMPAGCTQSEA